MSFERFNDSSSEDENHEKGLSFSSSRSRYQQAEASIVASLREQSSQQAEASIVASLREQLSQQDEKIRDLTHKVYKLKSQPTYETTTNYSRRTEESKDLSTSSMRSGFETYTKEIAVDSHDQSIRNRRQLQDLRTQLLDAQATISSLRVENTDITRQLREKEMECREAKMAVSELSGRSHTYALETQAQDTLIYEWQRRCDVLASTLVEKETEVDHWKRMYADLEAVVLAISGDRQSIHRHMAVLQSAGVDVQGGIQFAQPLNICMKSDVDRANEQTHLVCQELERATGAVSLIADFVQEMVGKLGDMQESAGKTTQSATGGVDTNNGSTRVEMKYGSSNRVDVETWTMLLHEARVFELSFLAFITPSPTPTRTTTASTTLHAGAASIPSTSNASTYDVYGTTTTNTDYERKERDEGSEGEAKRLFEKLSGHVTGIVRLLEETVLLQHERLHQEKELSQITTTLDNTAEKLQKLEGKYHTLKTHHKELNSELATLEQSRVVLHEAHVLLQSQYDQLVTENHGLQVTGAEQRVYCHDLEQAYLQLQADAKLIETLIAGPANRPGLGLGVAPGPGLVPGQGIVPGRGLASGPGLALQGLGPAINPVISIHSEIEKIRCRIQELEEKLLDATRCVSALAIYSRKQTTRADELASQKRLLMKVCSGYEDMKNGLVQLSKGCVMIHPQAFLEEKNGDGGGGGGGGGGVDETCLEYLEGSHEVKIFERHARNIQDYPAPWLKWWGGMDRNSKGGSRGEGGSGGGAGGGGGSSPLSTPPLSLRAVVIAVLAALRLRALARETSSPSSSPSASLPSFSSSSSSSSSSSHWLPPSEYIRSSEVTPAMLALVLVEAFHDEINHAKQRKTSSSSSLPSTPAQELGPGQGPSSPPPSQEALPVDETPTYPTYYTHHGTPHDTQGTYHRPLTGGTTTRGPPRSLWETLTGAHLFPMKKERNAMSSSLHNAKRKGLGMVENAKESGLSPGVMSGLGLGLESSARSVSRAGLETNKVRLKKGSMYGYPAAAKIHWTLVNMSRLLEHLRSKYTMLQWTEKQYGEQSLALVSALNEAQSVLQERSFTLSQPHLQPVMTPVYNPLSGSSTGSLLAPHLDSSTATSTNIPPSSSPAFSPSFSSPTGDVSLSVPITTIPTITVASAVSTTPNSSHSSTNPTANTHINNMYPKSTSPTNYFRLSPSSSSLLSYHHQQQQQQQQQSQRQQKHHQSPPQYHYRNQNNRMALAAAEAGTSHARILHAVSNNYAVGGSAYVMGNHMSPITSHQPPQQPPPSQYNDSLLFDIDRVLSPSSSSFR